LTPNSKRPGRRNVFQQIQYQNFGGDDMRAIFGKSEREPVKCWICGVDLQPSGQTPSGVTVCPCCQQTLCYELAIQGGAAVMRLRHSHAEFEENVSGLCASLSPMDGARFLVVDLAEMPSVTSSTLAGLVTLKRRVEQAGGAMVLCGVQPVTRSILESTKLDHYFKIFDTVSTALKSIDEVRAIGFSSIGCLATSCVV
jgi:anti-anti-sigma factor